MAAWLYTLPVWLMTLVIFAGVYGGTACLFVILNLLPRSRWAPILKEVSPVTLTPLAVVFGLLTGFLASNVWQSFQQARTLLAHEASEIRRVLLLSESLPPSVGAPIRERVCRHVHSVAEVEWPAMETQTMTLSSPPSELDRALALLLKFDPGTEGERLVLRDMTNAFEAALEARRQRILLSEQSIPVVNWLVILFLAFLLQLTIAFVHADRPATQAVAMAVFAGSVAACLVLLLSHDHPYIGAVSVQPTPLLEVIGDSPDFE